MLSEESADVDFATRVGWTRYWLVDPLDGTKDFVKRNGEFTVNIALIDRHAPVLGVVAVPVTGVCYAAGRRLGARRYDADGMSELRVRTPAAKPWRVAASRSHADRRTEAFIRNLGPSERVSIGSSLKFCLLAEGGIDIYPRFGPTCEWDTAAAQCVVEQAGGRVTDLGLEPLRCNTGNRSSTLTSWPSATRPSTGGNSCRTRPAGRVRNRRGRRRRDSPAQGAPQAREMAL